MTSGRRIIEESKSSQKDLFSVAQVSPITRANEFRTPADSGVAQSKTPGLQMKTHTQNPCSRDGANTSWSPSKAV